ncbi:MAG: carbon storage regulator CsrA [Spirochaetales bacterium]|nr:carbon storage regulator CsrA [Spirochaetales bacterium]
MLILSRRKNESIVIDERIVITITSIEKDQVKIGIEAPKDVKIFRKEIFDEIKKANLEASSSVTIIPKIK